MNKSVAVASALLPILLSLTLPGGAQTEAAAKSLLDKVSKTYATYKAIQADFTLDIKQQGQAANHTESGTINMEVAAGKYRISMNSQDMISDGKTQWMVLKDIEEVQITTVDHSPDAISPVNIFSFYETGYKYVSAPDERAGNVPLAVVELTPENSRSPYFKIKLRIDERNHQINDVTVFDKGGNRYIYTIKNMKANPRLADNGFTFKQADYPGMEIVDLR